MSVIVIDQCPGASFVKRPSQTKKKKKKRGQQSKTVKAVGKFFKTGWKKHTKFTHTQI